jgi:MFS family permease
MAVGIKPEYALSDFQVGLLFLAFNLPYALLQIFSGAMNRRLGRRYLIVAGFLTSGVAFTIAAISQGVMSLAIALFVAGIGSSTYHAQGIPLISDLFPTRRGEALGYHQTGGSVGSFIAPIAIGAVVEAAGWRMASIAVSLMGIVVALVLWYRLSDPHTKADETKGPRPTLQELKGPLVLVLAAAIYVVAFRGLTLFGIFYFNAKNMGSEAFLLLASSQVAGIFSGPICGRFSDKIDRKKVILYLVLVEGASAFGLVLLRGAPLYAVLLVFGFAFYGLLATMDAFIGDITRPEFYGTVIGINMAASFIVSSILSPTLGASIGIVGYDASFTILAAISLLSLPIIGLTKLSREKQ